MKVNELRIGNWIIYEQTSHRITGIHDNDKISSRWRKQSDSEPDYIHSINDINPIPLTPEILEKAGFVYDSVTYYKNNVHIGEFKSGLFLHSVLNKVSPKIEYLHQLQNLYFALTGEELIIEF